MSNEWIEISAKTVDDAINEGLIRLGTTTDKMDVEVLEKESAGFLGFIGKHNATIRVRIKETKPASTPQKKEVRQAKPATVKDHTETKTEDKLVAEAHRKPRKKFDDNDKGEPVSSERQEKAAKLRAKRGEAPVADKFNQFANTSTRSIATTNTKNIDDDSSETAKSTEKGITIKTKNNYKITDYKKREGEYKAANISDVANMLKRD